MNSYKQKTLTENQKKRWNMQTNKKQDSIKEKNIEEKVENLLNL